MSDRLHNSLKSETLEKTNTGNFQFALAKLQWSKTDIGFSVHVNSNTWISSGLQGGVFLDNLGLAHSECPFLQGECRAMSVSENFNLSSFAAVLEGAFSGVREAEKKLEACGIRIVDDRAGYYGDGHTSNGIPNKMKEGSDEHFDFAFTFQEMPDGKGWTTHRHPKTEKMMPDLVQALSFLNLKKMSECPQFGFEECYWSFIPLRGDGFMDGNTEWAHRAFEAHVANFTAAVSQLASINDSLRSYKLSFLNA
jgi:hypothetical protein